MNIQVRYYSQGGNIRGEFTALHKGRPNQDDLKVAKKFAEEIIERKQYHGR